MSKSTSKEFLNDSSSISSENHEEQQKGNSASMDDPVRVNNFFILIVSFKYNLYT
jgi:hypothetical protein